MVFEVGRCKIRLDGEGIFLRRFSMNVELLIKVAERNSSLERPLNLNNNKCENKQNNQQERGVADSCSLLVVPPAHCS